MEKTKIKFGTDGWRSVIAEDFTFNNVKRVSQALADVLPTLSKSKLVLIGYDRRFFSREFAETAARVMIGNGYKVELSNQPISSPCLSFNVHQRKASVGIMITASHNPYTFNGFKLKGPHGGSVDEMFTRSVEDAVDINVPKVFEGEVHQSDFTAAYLSNLKKLFPLKGLDKLKKTVVFDAMNGPGGALLEKIYGDNSSLKWVRSETNPLFGGQAPEPVEHYLDDLKKQVLASNALVGLAVDGDADRLGVVDDKGRYLPPHTVMPLLLLHLIEEKKLKGKVIQTVSMGYLPGRIAQHFKLPFEEVPVGFKYIAKRMGEEKVLFGGEESGGYGVGIWGPERDGLICALLLIEMLILHKKPLSALVDDLYARFGESSFKRVDFNLSQAINNKDEWTQSIISQLQVDQYPFKIKQINPLDGVKITLDDDSWVLMRPSGTEPLVRTYSESKSSASVETLLKHAEEWIHSKEKKEKSDQLEAEKKKRKRKQKK